MNESPLLFADWPAPPGVHAFTTLRQGIGVSQPPFDTFNLGNRYTADGDDPNRKTYQENTTTYVLLPAPPVIPAPQADIEVSYSRPER